MSANEATARASYPAPRRFAAVRRRPFTVAGLLLIVAMGIGTGALTSGALDHGWGRSLAYGPGALQAGHWWTLFTGPLLAIEPWCYLPVLLSFGLCVGYAETRLGTLRTALLWLGTQVGSVVVASALILAAGPASLRQAMDVGPSGGALAVGAAMTAFLSTAPRRILRAGLVGYAVLSLLVVGHLADVVHLVAVAGGLLIGSLIGPRRRPVVNRDRAVAHLQREGGGSLSWMTTWPGVRYLYDPRGEGYVAYRRHLGVALALGDPVGTAGWRDRAPSAFAAFCADEHLIPSHFAVSGPLARAIGGRSLQVGEDTLLDLPELEFRGKRWQDIRTARNRATRDGIRFELVVLADAAPDVVAQVRAISDGWLRRQRTPELGFTLGGVDHAMDPRVRVALALDADDRVHGFLSWLPVHGGEGRVDGWTLDLMRRPEDGFRPVIEFLIAESCLAFKEEGARVVSLSAAPLARSTGEPEGRLQRGLERSARILEPLYGFASLHAFKAKFSPRCEPLHLTYRSLADLPRIGAAVLVAYLVTPKTREVGVPVARPLPPVTAAAADRSAEQVEVAA
ncbi:bifunctional lysylphosphatidylglycerol flippase/synthetase MprF [Nocardioides sp. L-11A]|uniref:bifunctional lysylphosphatidylglycerol flippase/synthetase MprF n=1 Tax=Nocardioides sp. L-11A TaxID=3043848 RepID=UPI002499E5B7|nr:phosphatidylglycerol lysyltransferase domain-containing protein [Nocardioides sp. L-11A]